MKKSVLIVIAILAVIVIGAHYADKATRLPHIACRSPRQSGMLRTAWQARARAHPEGSGREGSQSHAVQGQGRAGQFLGDLVRALQSGDSVS